MLTMLKGDLKTSPSELAVDFCVCVYMAHEKGRIHLSKLLPSKN